MSESRWVQRLDKSNGKEEKKANLVQTIKKRASHFYTNTSSVAAVGYDWLIWTVYNYGLHLSVLYGISTRPPYLMYAWYQLTGNKEGLERMMRQQM